MPTMSSATKNILYHTVLPPLTYIISSLPTATAVACRLGGPQGDVFCPVFPKPQVNLLCDLES